MLPFLQLSPSVTLDGLWANLARTRLERRRMTARDGAEYARFYGIATPDRLAREVANLRLRESVLERWIEREKAKARTDKRPGLGCFVQCQASFSFPYAAR